MSREAMKQALEALEKLAKVEHPSHKVTYRKSVNGHVVTIYPHKIAVDAITLLRQALAEPEPRNQCAETCERARLCAICARGLEEPKHDLVCVCGAVWEGEMMVHPPRKREWVGLTDEEVSDVIDNVLEGGGWLDVARALEAAIKRKNT